MKQTLAYLFAIMLILTACQGNQQTETEEEFPDFSDEEMQEMIANNPQAQMQLQQQQQQANNNLDNIIGRIEGELAKDPQNPKHDYHLAKLYYQKYLLDSLPTFNQKAIEHYTSVIQNEDTYEKGHAYYNRMLCYVQTQAWEKALADINQFVKVNQGRTPVNYQAMRAEIHYQRGAKEKACADYKAALVVAQQDSLPIGNEEAWKDRCP